MNPDEPSKPVQTTHGKSPEPHGNRETVGGTKPGKLLRLPAVMERCALGRSSIYAGVKAGTFPAPVRLSARAVGFREDEIDRWVSERVKTGGQ